MDHSITDHHQLGAIINGSVIGFPKSGKFILASCITCQKKRWVKYKNGKPISPRCVKCARGMIRSWQWPFPVGPREQVHSLDQ